MATIHQIDEAANAQVVDRILDRDVTRGELLKAFNRVAPKDHWKNPIDAIVVVFTDCEKLLIDRAIVFFTGSKATFEMLTVVTQRGKSTGAAKYRVRAAGYYAAIGA